MFKYSTFHNKISINKLIFIFITILVLAFSSYLYENKVFAIRFVDEEDNIVLGHYLLKGEKLYLDLFSHHQPLGYIFSAGVQQTFDVNSLYLLIKRHREAIILYSFLWSVLLIWRFGWPLFSFVTIYEITKIFLFGNLFLSETLVVYPLIFIASYILMRKERSNIYEIFFLGICFGLGVFLLLPIWPVLFVLFLMLVFKLRKNRKNIFILLSGILPVFLLSVYFSNVTKYFENVFFINFKYYIPLAAYEPISSAVIKSFITPLMSFFYIENTTMTNVIKFLTGVWTLLLVMLYKNKKFHYLGLTIILLWLSNLRYSPPGAQFYGGFHLLPWYALFLLIIFIGISNLKLSKKKNLFLVGFIFFTIFLLTYPSKHSIFAIRDMNTDQYVNYSHQFDIGEAIRIMKDDNDRLFVEPDEWLLYWQADIKHASFMVNYYPWMVHVPSIRDEVINVFSTNPPEFMYCTPCVESNAKERGDYVMFKKDSKYTKLFVLRNKVNTLDKQQIERLNFFNFSWDI